MKRVILHSKKVFGNHWFIILVASSISIFIGIGLFFLFLIYSLIFTQDPISVNDILNSFTEEELAIIFNDKVDEKVNDDEYLSLVARYQSYVCDNKKIDEITTWVGSAVNKEAFIYLYELNDKRIEGFDIDKQKEGIRNSLDKNNVQTSRIINSGRSLIFRYTFKYSGEINDVIFSNEELSDL